METVEYKWFVFSRHLLRIKSIFFLNLSRFNSTEWSRDFMSSCRVIYIYISFYALLLLFFWHLGFPIWNWQHFSYSLFAHPFHVPLPSECCLEISWWFVFITFSILSLFLWLLFFNVLCYLTFQSAFQRQPLHKLREFSKKNKNNNNKIRNKLSNHTGKAPISVCEQQKSTHTHTSVTTSWFLLITSLGSSRILLCMHVTMSLWVLFSLLFAFFSDFHQIKWVLWQIVRNVLNVVWPSALCVQCFFWFLFRLYH